MSGILANSSTATMVDADTTPDNARSGYVTADQITLGVTGTPVSTVWSMAKPSAETAACELSSSTDPNPTFTATVDGYFTVVCVVDGTTTYVLRMAVARVGVVSTLTAVRMLPILNASVPTPATGRTLFSSSDLNDLAQKLPDGITYALAGGAGGGGGGSGSGAYATIAALKAISSTLLATLDDGVSLAYVTPLRAWFVWQAASTVADDTTDFLSVAVTVNGAAAGRWRRLDWAHPAWREQAAWFVDTAGSNANDGATALTPVKTDAEIQRRWGAGVRARLTVPVTITYAQAPVGQTNYLFELGSGAALSIVGTPTITKPGTILTAVQAQVRTAGAELAWAITATGLDATDVGKLAFITASGTGANVGAYAMVLKDETGGKLRVSPFGTVDATTAAFTQRTPQVGDTIEIRTPTTLSVGSIDCHGAAAGVTSAGLNRVLFDSVTLDSASTADGGIYGRKASVYYARSILNGITWMGEGTGGKPPHLMRGGGIGTAQLYVRSGGANSITCPGCLGTVSVGANGHATITADTYFQNSGLTVARGAFVNSQGLAFFDRSTSDASLAVTPGGFCQQSGAVPDWGAANAGHGLNVQSGSSYVYVTKPTINSGLGAGREAKVGGTDKLYSAVPYIEPANNAVLVLNDGTDGPAAYYQTYATIALLKAITATRLGNLQDGQRVYVATLRAWFAWHAASAVADDTVAFLSVAVTANGASAGRFVRLGWAHPSWRAQTAWFVSTAGSNENDGATVGAPVLSDEEIARRWGAGMVLTVPVTVTYAQSPTTTTNLDVGYADGGSLSLVGTPTVTKAGTVISAVQAQVRTAGSELGWAITGTGLGATEVGKIAVITAGTANNIGAYAGILKDETGGKVRISPFGKATADGLFSQVTPVAGDTVEIRENTTVLKVAFINVQGLSQLAAVASPVQNVVVFDSLLLDGSVGGSLNGGIVRNEGAQISYVRCTLQDLILASAPSTFSKLQSVCGGLITAGAGGVDLRGNIIMRQVGVLNTIISESAPTGNASFQADNYFQNSQLSMNAGCPAVTQGIAFFDRSSSDATFTLGASSNGGSAYVRQTGAVADWGTANAGHGLVVRSASSYVYATKPTINSGLGAGREALIGGTDKLLSAVPYIEPGCNAMVTSADNIDGPAVFYSAYATIALLKAISANRLAGLVNGQRVFVTTLRSWFAWDATSAVADDTTDFLSVAVTANGAAAGRFVRVLSDTHPSWVAQTAWFVSTAGNNENDGLTLGTAVKTDAEIQRRWAGPGKRGRIAVTVTITYAQSPAGETNLIFEIITGGQLRLVGTPTVTKAGTVLTAVQTQVRTAGAELGWAITGTGLGATEVGKLVAITASGTGANVGATAMILKDETGGKLRISPFGTLAEATTVYTNITPQVGDTIEIRDVAATTLTLGKIEAYSAASVQIPAAFVCDSLMLDGGASAVGSVYAAGPLVIYTRCILSKMILNGHSAPSTTPHSVRGGGIIGAVFSIRNLAALTSVGILAPLTIRQGGNVFLQQDCYFQNAGVTVALGGMAQGTGNAFFDRSTASSSLFVQEGGRYVATGAVPDWGTANAGYGVVVQSNASYGYATKPTINSGLGVGREAIIGGTDKLYSAVPYVEPANNAALVLTNGTDGPAVFYSAYANVAALKAISSNRLAGLQDGQRVYVATLKSWFAWHAASAVADDTTDFLSVAVTANGASAGRFVRLADAHPAWLAQTAWFVSTAGSNENDGATVGAPVLTDAEIQRRWGAGARLSVPVTVTYAQSPTGITNYNVEIVTNASLTLVGTATVTKAGTVISAVQAQVRTAGSELGWAITATGLDATDVGKIAVITAGTAGNIGAYAAVLKDETGGKVRVSPFGKFTANTSPFTQVTPVAGDTIDIRDPTTLKVGTIEVRSLTNDNLTGTVVNNYLMFDSIRESGDANDGNGGVCANRVTVFHCVRGAIDAISLSGSTGSLSSHKLCGGLVHNASPSFGVVFRGGTVGTVHQSGCLTSITASAGSLCILQADTYFQNCGLTISRGGVANTQGVAFFDRSSSNSSLLVSALGMCQQTGAVPDWGAANAGHGLTIQSAGSCVYTTKPTVNSGLGAGREAQVGGTDKLYSVVPYVEATNNAALVLLA